MKTRRRHLRIVANRRVPAPRLIRLAVQKLGAGAGRARDGTEHVELFAGVHVAGEGEGGDVFGVVGAVDEAGVGVAGGALARFYGPVGVGLILFLVLGGGGVCRGKWKGNWKGNWGSGSEYGVCIGGEAYQVVMPILETTNFWSNMSLSTILL